MGRTRRVVDGEIEVTETPDGRVYRITKRELRNQKAEIQTKIDHLLLDIEIQRDLKQDIVDDIAALEA